MFKALYKTFLAPRRNQRVDPRITPIGNPNPRCPYCGKSLGKMPSRKRPCPHCGKSFVVRTRPYDSKKVLVTTEQVGQIEEQWSIVNGIHDQYLSSRTEQKIAHERAKSQLTKQFGKAPSENDIQWRLLGEEATKHALDGNWGLYRNVRFRMAELTRKEGKHKTALFYYLWVCYLDLNGPDNAGGRQDYPDLLREFPPFNPKLAITAPGIIYYVSRIIKKLEQQCDALLDG